MSVEITQETDPCTVPEAVTALDMAIHYAHALIPPVDPRTALGWAHAIENHYTNTGWYASLGEHCANWTYAPDEGPLLTWPKGDA